MITAEEGITATEIMPGVVTKMVAYADRVVSVMDVAVRWTSAGWGTLLGAV
jgi:hypothetical protein